jgi:putative ABC transport system permease protein
MKRVRRLSPARLSPADVARVATVGLRTRRLRGGLSAIGIAVGVGAMVAVLGLSASSQAGLLAEIDALGTNLIRVTTGHDVFGDPIELPTTSAGMIARIPSVYAVGVTGATHASVYRSPLIPRGETGGVTVIAARSELLAAVGSSVAQGNYLNAANETEPVAVLGSVAASHLGIDRVFRGERLWLGGQWFYIAGILTPAPLAPEIDQAVLVGFSAAARYLGFDGHPTTIYLRSATGQIPSVEAMVARMAYPEHPDEVAVSRPSDALVARAEAEGAFNALFIGLAAVALLVGGVGVANIMVITVLERRGEIGLRRALGATRGQIRLQFFAEAILLALAGGVIGVLAGIAITMVYAAARSWPPVIPAVALSGGLGAAVVVGAVAGLLPALRAARLTPTEALRGVR